MERDTSKVRRLLIIGIVLTLLIGALLHANLDRLQSCNQFYRWLRGVQAITSAEFLSEAVDRDSEEWALYEAVAQKFPELNTFDEKTLWKRVATSGETKDERVEFKRLMRENKITIINPGELFYRSELGNMAGLIFGFRHIIADLLWRELRPRPLGESGKPF